MKPTRRADSVSLRHRRIGRKALQGDRLARALSASHHAHKKDLWGKLLRPKAIVVTSAITIVLGAAGFIGSQFYFTQAAATQKAATTEQQNQAKTKSIAADACRRKKVEQKSDLIGKITYDELYDYDECDK